MRCIKHEVNVIYQSINRRRKHFCHRTVSPTVGVNVVPHWAAADRDLFYWRHTIARKYIIQFALLPPSWQILMCVSNRSQFRFTGHQSIIKLSNISRTFGVSLSLSVSFFHFFPLSGARCCSQLLHVNKIEKGSRRVRYPAAILNMLRETSLPNLLNMFTIAATREPPRTFRDVLEIHSFTR